MSTEYPQPEILREAGYDQTAVPSEAANETPKAKPTIEDIEDVDPKVRVAREHGFLR